MTRIALIIGQLGLGGAEKQLCLLATGLRDRDYDPLVIVLQAGGQREAELKACGVAAVTLSRSSSFDLRRAWQVVAALRGFKPAIVHGFDSVGSAYGQLAGVIAGVPIIIGGVRSEIITTRRFVYLERLLRRRTDAILSNSFAGKRSWVETARLPKERISVVPNGFDFKRMERPPHSHRPLSELIPGLKANEPVIGCIGSIYKLKNPLMLVDVAAQLRASGHNAQFVWIGDGPMRAQVENAVVSRGLRGIFHLAGKREDAAWLARDFDIGVLTSITEGMPNAIMEYMYWGVPVVTTDVGDCGRLVEHGRSGFVVANGDSKAMVASLQSLVLDPAGGRAMGRLGRSKLKAEFSVEAMVEQTVALYDELRARRNMA